MYILKTKGWSNIPPYIQLRDDDFVLISHFRIEKAKTEIQKYGFSESNKKILEIINDLPSGTLYKI